MSRSIPAANGHARVSFRDEPRALLTTAADREEADRLRRVYRDVIRRRKLTGFGVFVQPYAGVFGLFIGRHDGGPIVPDTAALRAAMRLAAKGGQSCR